MSCHVHTITISIALPHLSLVCRLWQDAGLFLMHVTNFHWFIPSQKESDFESLKCQNGQNSSSDCTKKRSLIRFYSIPEPFDDCFFGSPFTLTPLVRYTDIILTHWYNTLSNSIYQIHMRPSNPNLEMCCFDWVGLLGCCLDQMRSMFFLSDSFSVVRVPIIGSQVRSPQSPPNRTRNCHGTLFHSIGPNIRAWRSPSRDGGDGGADDKEVWS